MLEAQKVIEDVENEAAQHLTRDTIARMHRKHYNLGGSETSDEKWLSAVSALKVMS